MIGADDGGVDVSTTAARRGNAPMLPIRSSTTWPRTARSPTASSARCRTSHGVGPSNSLSSAGIVHGDWHTVGGGEAGHAVADPSDPDVVYAGEYFGILTRYDHRTGRRATWPPGRTTPRATGPPSRRYRFQWTAPIAISPHDPKTVYYGGNVLFRTQDGGQSWTAISGDLTRDDETKQRWSGGPSRATTPGPSTTARSSRWRSRPARGASSGWAPTTVSCT